MRTGCIGVLLVLTRLACAASEPLPLTSAPVPAWVEPAPAPNEPEAAANAPGTGLAYLLLDEQVNVARHERYVQVVRAVSTPAAVQEGSTVGISFDPDFQAAEVHHVRLWRDGRPLDRLDLAAARVIQQEEDLDRHIYNGALTAVIFLEGVRAGDRIDYAYTVRGANPVLGGRFADSFEMQWELPVRERRLRVLWPAERPVAVRALAGAAEPERRERAGQVEARWVARDLAALPDEDLVPAWYDPAAWVQLSEFRDWDEVRAWGRALYAVTNGLPADLRARMRQWSREGASPESTVLAALECVQDEVRYLGLEHGPHSLRPAEPGRVYERRFGDCKDKALLLCTILRELGFASDPVLVNTDARHAIAGWLPSPYDFDHVIACVRVEGRTLWLDPTLSHCRGAVERRYTEDFGLGLPIDGGTGGLVRLDPGRAGWPLTTVRETFSVSQPPGPAELEVVTVAEGRDADDLRADLAETAREGYRKQCLDFYAQHYPDIQTGAVFEVRDDAAANRVEVLESYRLDPFWQLSDDGLSYEAQTYPQWISDRLTRPVSTRRTLPLEVPYPQHAIHETVLLLPEDWPEDDSFEALTNAAARLTIRREGRQARVVLTVELETLTNCVAAGEVAAYAASVDRMRDALGYTLTCSNGGGLSGLAAFNVPVFLLGVVSMALLAGAAVWLHRRSPAGPPPVPAEGAGLRLQGIRGWLALVAVGVVVIPVLAAWHWVALFPSFTLDTWHSLTVPGQAAYHPLWAGVLLFGLLGNQTVLVLSSLAAVLFFQKRRAYPRVQLAVLVLSAALVTADYVLAGLIPAAADGGDWASGREVVCAWAVLFVWGPYLLVSRRVRQTFVR